MAKITYANKINIKSSIEGAQYKVSASDMNEIKESVNVLYDDGANDIFDIFGWTNHSDDVSSNLVVNSTPQKLTINGLGSSTNTTYKPSSMTGDIWNPSTNLIEPEVVGSAFDLRIDLKITAKSGNPDRLNINLDIGGQATETIVIVERFSSLVKSAPFGIDVGLPIFCLETFVENGGQIFLSTNTGTVTIENRSIFLKRDYRPNGV